MEKEELVIPKDEVKPLIIDGLIFRSAYDFALTENDLEQSYLELGETESVRRSTLQALKKKLSGTPKLHHHTDDETLLRYLRYQKFNVDKAYAMLNNLYRMRNDYPEEFSLPSNLEDILSTKILKFLPYRTEEGSMICWVDYRRADLDILLPVNGMKLINALGDIYTRNPASQVNKFIGIWDMRGLTLRHYLTYINLTTARLLRRVLLDCYPWRIKYIILIHCNPLVQAAYNAVRFLLKKKVADRVILLGSDYKELHQYVNPKILPKEYGGDIEEEECLIKEFILKNIPFMRYERSFKFVPS